MSRGVSLPDNICCGLPCLPENLLLPQLKQILSGSETTHRGVYIPNEKVKAIIWRSQEKLRRIILVMGIDLLSLVPMSHMVWVRG